MLAGMEAKPVSSSAYTPNLAPCKHDDFIVRAMRSAQRLPLLTRHKLVLLALLAHAGPTGRVLLTNMDVRRLASLEHNPHALKTITGDLSERGLISCLGLARAIGKSGMVLRTGKLEWQVHIGRLIEEGEKQNPAG